MEDMADARKLAERVLHEKKLSNYDVPDNTLGKPTIDNNDKTDKKHY